jgi:hypothetical protein
MTRSDDSSVYTVTGRGIFPKNEEVNRKSKKEDWPITREGITALLTRTDQVEPGWLSPEDDAAWRIALREQKEFE